MALKNLKRDAKPVISQLLLKLIFLNSVMDNEEMILQ